MKSRLIQLIAWITVSLLFAGCFILYGCKAIQTEGIADDEKVVRVAVSQQL